MNGYVLVVCSTGPRIKSLRGAFFIPPSFEIEKIKKEVKKNNAFLK